MAPRVRSYAPLWCKSNYSFLEGASHPEELIEHCAHLGIESIALTDRDGVYGIVRAHVKARELGIHLIIGSEVTIDDGSTIILLATDRKGYANLCNLISDGRLRSPKGECSVRWKEVCAYAEGLLALWGGEKGSITAKPDPLFVARNLRDAFGDRLYALVTRHFEPADVRRERRLRERAVRYGIPTVAAVEVLYHTPERSELHDVLTCIRYGVTLATAGRLTRPNAEHALKSHESFCDLFVDDLESVWRTEEVTSRCTFSLSEIRYRYPSEELPDGNTSSERLRQLTFEGARRRYPDGVPGDVIGQIEKELELIRDLDYEGYFLTMWEIVQYCRREEILCQGRGSAANSAVCYCLGITAVDPVRTGLLFERFLSRERAEPPDIDLDIEHNRREEVIQHVYQKYGRTHAAMVANFVRYRSRSAVREVGKVLDLSETAIDRFAKMLSYYDRVSEEALAAIGFDPKNRVHRLLMRLCHEIQDFPRHLSIHPGGFLLGHEPVRNLVPVENATMPDRTVIQWDKEDLEAIGLFKVDLLGLGMLTVADLSFRLIDAHMGKHYTMASVPADDKATFEMIQRADTVGVFQIESRAQMAMLPRLKPRTYYDLVIEVAIVRPGPITGGMVHPYLRRRNGEEPIIYPHLSLIPVLEKTLGVPLFQEQVMRLAIVAADYTPGESDQLRRDMAAWRRHGRLERHRDRLITRMTAKGISQEFAERVFEQIKGFGEYGFPESHAASFALITYVTAYLKCHYPAAFTCALLNAQPMGFYAPATIIDDAKRHGVDVRPVDVQHSRWDCTLEPVSRGGGCGLLAPRARSGRLSGRDHIGSARRASGATNPVAPDEGLPRSARTVATQTATAPVSNPGFAVRIGLRYVHGFRESDWEKIEKTRQLGSFRSLEDFAARTGLEDAALRKLAEAGALESSDDNRRSAIWRSRGIERHREPVLPLVSRSPQAQFDALDLFETVDWDYRATGNSPRAHPLAALRGHLTSLKLPLASDVRRMPHGRRVRYAGLVICRQRPSTAGGVVFMTLEDETGFVNVVVWQNVFKRHMVLVKTASFVGVTGKLQVSSNVTHLIAESFWTPRLQRPPRRHKSRDFP
jgi:error-prone DNA polymerase